MTGNKWAATTRHQEKGWRGGTADTKEHGGGQARGNRRQRKRREEDDYSKRDGDVGDDGDHELITT